jgi:hypothetical protein
MSDEPSKGKLHIDTDWKEEAAREKERLAAQEKLEREKVGAQPREGAGLLDLVNLIAMQAAIGLGGAKSPDGTTIPANPEVARYHIDLLEVLEKKTEGNLTAEEKRVLSSVLYELRMQFVHVTSGKVPPPEKPPGETS